jgi:hypothetical protein
MLSTAETCLKVRKETKNADMTSKTGPGLWELQAVAHQMAIRDCFTVANHLE